MGPALLVCGDLNGCLLKDHFEDHATMRHHIHGLLLGAALGVGLLGAGAVNAEEEDFIDYRQHIMKTLREQMAVLGMVLEDKAPAEDLRVHAKGFMLAAQTAEFAFSVEAPGGAARSAVWENWEDFSKQLATLSGLAKEISQAAEQGSASDVAAKLKAMNCKGCHDTYREPNS